MEWTAQLDGYCERLDFTFWSEPVNAISNLAFILAALIVLPIARRDRGELLLVAILIAIGIGSFLFHTFATRWSAMLDVLPILLFILTYIYLASVRFLNFPVWAAALAVLGYVPYSAAFGWLIAGQFGSMNGSVTYVPVALLIVLFGIGSFRAHPRTSRGLFVGAGLLAISLVFRSIDQAVCPSFALGTHFLWHLLNAVLLGHMISLLPHHRPSAA